MRHILELKRIWSTMAQTHSPTSVEVDIEGLKRAFSLFAVGDYYNYVFDVPAGQFKYVSPAMTQVLGYEPREFTVENFMTNLIHPDDVSFVIAFEHRVVEFLMNLAPEKVMKYKVRYDYRIKVKDGNYIRILQQVITAAQGAKGEVLKSFGIHTNITHLKPEGKPMLSLIGLDGEDSFIDVKPTSVLLNANCTLSRRELDIVSLLAQGLSNKEIASHLHISVETVATHRRNMLRKTKSKNSTALVAYSIRGGFI